MKFNLVLTIALFLMSNLICQAQVIVGAYSPVSASDKMVVAAADFAVKAKAREIPRLKLVSVASARRQVVAGMNYEMCLVVTEAKRRREVTAVVYHDLQNQMSLTSWKPGRCSTRARATTTASQQRAANPAATSGALAPDAVVKNLYQAQKTGKNAPFFQNTDRAAVDRFFTKDFADLIWQDAVRSEDGVGVLGADPLFNAQDTQITLFKIGAPQYGDGGSANGNIATVEVSFRNFREPETIRFILERDAAETWKISDIRYQNGDMLKGMYFAAARDAANGGARGEFEGDFRVGAATCAVKPIKMAFEVRCSNLKAVQTFFFDSDSDTARPVFQTENGKSRFAFDDDTYASGTFTDAAGRTAKVNRVR